MPFWPGLRALRHIPKLWRSVSDFGVAAEQNEDLSGGSGNYAAGLAETARPELNKFNQLLLDKLK